MSRSQSQADSAWFAFLRIIGPPSMPSSSSCLHRVWWRNCERQERSRKVEAPLSQAPQRAPLRCAEAAPSPVQCRHPRFIDLTRIHPRTLNNVRQNGAWMAHLIKMPMNLRFRCRPKWRHDGPAHFLSSYRLSPIQEVSGAYRATPMEPVRPDGDTSGAGRFLGEVHECPKEARPPRTPSFLACS